MALRLRSIQRLSYTTTNTSKESGLFKTRPRSTLQSTEQCLDNYEACECRVAGLKRRAFHSKVLKYLQRSKVLFPPPPPEHICSRQKDSAMILNHYYWDLWIIYTTVNNSITSNKSSKLPLLWTIFLLTNPCEGPKCWSLVAISPKMLLPELSVKR